MSLQVWLPLTGDLHNQGLSNTTAINNGAIVNNNGKIGKCYLSSSSSQTIVVTWQNLESTISGSNKKYSFTCWAKPTLIQGWLIKIGASSCGLWWGANSNRLVWNDSDSGKRLASSPEADDNLWHHYAVIIDKTNLSSISYTFYQDGKYFNSWANQDGSSITQTTGSTITINPYYGQVQDIRIYDHCLSAKEVEEISKGLMLHYTLDNNINQTNWLLPNFETTIVRASGNSFIDYEYYTDLITNTETTYIVDFYAKGSVDAMEMDVYFRNSSGSAYALTSKQILTTDWKHYSLPLSGSPSSLALFRVRCYGGTANDIIYIRNMRLSSNNMPIRDTIIYDSSGYNNNGTIVGSLKAISPSPRYNYAIQFDGSSYIKKTDFIYNSNIWSVSCWYYRTSDPTEWECIFCLSKGNGADNNKKIAALPNSGRIWYKGESGSQSIYQIGLTTWTFLTMTCDGTTVTVYQNGISIGTFNASTELTECSDLVLGARSGSTGITSANLLYNGNISDFRIYATAFTEEQVKELYNTSMTIDNQGNIYARELVE